MLTPIPLIDCPGLVHLILAADERGVSFTIDSVRVSVERIGDHAIFEAISPDFGLSVVVPGWYIGEHGAPAHVAIVGEAHTCVRWLSLNLADKLALIDRLPLRPADHMLCRLSI